jgi:hypothetical protein
MVFFAITPAMAQAVHAQNDTVKEKRDQMYKKLEDYSKRKKFTKFIHKLIFRPVQPQVAATTRKNIKKDTPELQNTYDAYHGKIVRRIIIETLDPFGFSISDTTRKPSNWAQNAGNRIHLKTKQNTIRNLLLFKRDKPLDSLLIKDSERLIRQQRYVRRVAITPSPVIGRTNNDSIDIYVRVLDSWSLIPNGSASGSRTSFEVRERNFLGLGHEVRNDFSSRFNNGETSNISQYTVNNIMNTYIRGQATYQIWKSKNSVKSIGFQRDFYSAYTKWAGGIYLESRFQRDTLPNILDEWSYQNFKSDAQDYWAGYGFKIYKGETETARTTRLVTTGRYFIRKYKETPTFAYDSIGFYSSEKLYMASIGLTSRKFVQDKFLFNYDIVEDIPIGKVYSATFGVQDKYFERRLYFGGRYAFGNYYKWGYFSTDIQVGSYFSGDKPQQTTLRIDALYFTNIRNWGEWRFRHFIRPTIVFGDNRMQIYTDQLTINDNNNGGIPGFNSRHLKGTKKALLTLQTQSYSPWNISGFRLNPFASLTLGVIGDEQNKLYNTKVYSKIGLGLLIYNDYLIFNSFQLSIAYYPSIPDNGSNIFKMNTIQNTDIVLPDFQVGKPDVVPYN